MVSVIVPCFNSSNYIESCLISILNQSYFHKINEIIIIDDYSEDYNELLEIIVKFRKKFNEIKIIRNKTNQGPGYSRNLGIKKAISQYIAFLDSDDYWFKDKIKIQLEILEKNPNIDMLCTLNEFTSNQNRKLLKLNLISMLFTNYIFTSSVILKKNNLFFKETHYCEDYFLWINMLIAKYNIYRLNIKLVSNIHNKNNNINLTSKKILMHSSLQKIFISLYTKLPTLFILIIFAQLLALLKFLIKLLK